MFEDLWEDDDLIYTVNRLRVHVLTLKKAGDPYPLFRLYGQLALALARCGEPQGATDALNDAAFLLLEHGWRGTEKEAWAILSEVQVMKVLGHTRAAQRNLDKALSLLTEDAEPELKKQLEDARSTF